MRRFAIFFLFSGAAVTLLNLNLSPIDEPEWIAAGGKFLAALERADWAGTFVGAIAGHPGITVLWVSALLHAFLSALDITLLHRAAFTLISFFLCGSSLYLLRRHLPRAVLALIFFYWLANPFLLISLEITWADQLFLWLSFLTAVLIVAAGSRLRAGITLGLALLTKIAAVFLLPAIFFYYLLTRPRRWALSFLLVLLAATLTYFVLYPAMWTDPWSTPFNRFRRSSEVVLSPAPPAPAKLVFYPARIMFFDPIIPLSLALLMIPVLKRPQNLSGLLRPPATLALFGLLYLLTVVAVRPYWPDLFWKNLPRYLAPAVPFFSILCFSWFRKWFPKRRLLAAVTLILLIFPKILLFLF